MELLIDFPDRSRVDKHFGSFTVQTDPPPAASTPSPFDVFLFDRDMRRYLRAGFLPCWDFTSNAAFPRTEYRSLNGRSETNRVPWWKNRSRDQTAAGLSGEISRGGDPCSAIMRGQKTSKASTEVRDHNNDELSILKRVSTVLNKQHKTRIRKPPDPATCLTRRVK